MIALCRAFLFMTSLNAADWQTVAERTHYQQTARYAEVIDYCRRLEQSSPWVRFRSIGRSPEGREIPLLIISRDGDFSGQAAAAKGEEVALVIACIHPGECEGKDAGLALARDLVVERKMPSLLEHLTILLLPIFGVDGHERFGPFNRVNQNGPAEMGWRTTAQNYNLNRDFLKADSPEMRAWLKMFNEWLPDLIIDTHTTDGADYQYDLTYGLEMAANLHPALVRWQQEAFERQIFPALAKKGHKLAPYLVLRDPNDPAKGFEGGVAQPRFSTGYGAIQNRPALLVETHMLKSYQNRVTATYDLLVETFAYLNRHPGQLRARIREADAETRRLSRIYPLTFTNTGVGKPFAYEGFAWDRQLSEVSGGIWTQYQPQKPVTMSVPFYGEFAVDRKVRTPEAYLIPMALNEVADRLRWHGVILETLEHPLETTVETYEFSEVAWEGAPFENHIRLKNFKAAPVKKLWKFPAGSFRVAMDQRAANVAVHLLEPWAPDSLLQWGCLNFIFETKEYGEEYILERLAREMMKKDPALEAEFRQKIAEDPRFASSSRARLDFFYTRSPYADPGLNVYPIGRVISRP